MKLQQQQQVCFIFTIQFNDYLLISFLAKLTVLLCRYMIADSQADQLMASSSERKGPDARGCSNRYVLYESFDQIFANVISRILTVPFIIISLQEAKRFYFGQDALLLWRRKVADGLVERAGGELRGVSQGRQWRGLTGSGERKPRGPADALVRHTRGSRPRGPDPLLPSCQLWCAVVLLVDVHKNYAHWSCPCLPSPSPRSPARCPGSATQAANLSYLMT